MLGLLSRLGAQFLGAAPGADGPTPGGGGGAGGGGGRVGNRGVAGESNFEAGKRTSEGEQGTEASKKQRFCPPSSSHAPTPSTPARNNAGLFATPPCAVSTVATPPRPKGIATPPRPKGIATPPRPKGIATPPRPNHCVATPPRSHSGLVATPLRSNSGFVATLPRLAAGDLPLDSASSIGKENVAENQFGRDDGSAHSNDDSSRSSKDDDEEYDSDSSKFSDDEEEEEGDDEEEENEVGSGSKKSSCATLTDKAKLYDRLDGCTEAKNWTTEEWNQLAKDLGGYFLRWADFSGQRSTHPLYMKAYRAGGVMHRGRHPILDSVLPGKHGLTVRRAIALLLELRDVQQQFPALSVLGTDVVLVPRKSRRDTSWQRQLTGEYKKLLESLDRAKQYSGQTSTGPSGKSDKSQRSTSIQVDCIHEATGLVRTNAEAYDTVLNALRLPLDEESRQFVKDSYTASYRRFADLRVPRSSLFGLNSVSEAIGHFDRYCENPIVRAINLLMNWMMHLQSEAVREAMTPENREILLKVWYEMHNNKAYANELIRRRDAGETCDRECSCWELFGGIQNFVMIMELHHDGDEAKAAKKKLREEGKKDNPSDYDEAELLRHRELLASICRYRHHHVTKEEHDAGSAERERASHRCAQNQAIRQAVQIYAHPTCPITDVSITRETRRGYEGHHASGRAKVQLYQFTFDTAKPDLEETLSKLYKYSGSEKSFLELLFRELTVTRTIDSRLHNYIWHWILKNRDALAEEGFEFEYPFEEEGRILRYTGEESIETLLGIAESELNRLAVDGLIAIPKGLVNAE